MLIICYSDDLTVEVIFFGDEKGTGNVILNDEASAAAKEPRPKL
jgi:pyruvate dehydrogenase phosphatase